MFHRMTLLFGSMMCQVSLHKNIRRQDETFFSCHPSYNSRKGVLNVHFPAPSPYLTPGRGYRWMTGRGPHPGVGISSGGVFEKFVVTRDSRMTIWQPRYHACQQTGSITRPDEGLVAKHDNPMPGRRVPNLLPLWCCRGNLEVSKPLFLEEFHQ